MQAAEFIEKAVATLELHRTGLGQMVGDNLARIRAVVDPKVRNSYLFHAPYGMSEREAWRVINGILYNGGLQQGWGRRHFESFLKGHLLEKEQRNNPNYRWGEKLLEMSWQDMISFAKDYPEAYRSIARVHGRRVARWDMDDVTSAPRMVITWEL